MRLPILISLNSIGSFRVNMDGRLHSSSLTATKGSFQFVSVASCAWRTLLANWGFFDFKFSLLNSSPKKYYLGLDTSLPRYKSYNTIFLRIRGTRVLRLSSGKATLNKNFCSTPTVTFGPSSHMLYHLFAESVNLFAYKVTTPDYTLSSYRSFDILRSSYYITHNQLFFLSLESAYSGLLGEIRLQLDSDESLDLDSPADSVAIEELDLVDIVANVNIASLPLIGNKASCSGVDFKVSDLLIFPDKGWQSALRFNQFLLPSEYNFGLSLSTSPGLHNKWVPQFTKPVTLITWDYYSVQSPNGLISVVGLSSALLPYNGVILQLPMLKVFKLKILFFFLQVNLRDTGC